MMKKLLEITEIASLPKSAISQIWILQIEDLNVVSKFAVAIFYTFQEISRQRALRSGRFIVLNDSASSKMVIKMYLHFFQSFWSYLNIIEATYIWLLIGTSFASLTCNKFSLENEKITFMKMHVNWNFDLVESFPLILRSPDVLYSEKYSYVVKI